jgi:1-phosphatidylinositol-3-phosphate 5-kinase
MESPQVLSPLHQSPFSRSRSNTKVADDVTSLTSFNPFSEEDENDQSSYALVTSLFSRVRNSIAAPLSSAVAAASGTTASNATVPSSTTVNEQRRTSGPLLHSSQPSLTSRNSSEKPMSLALKSPKPAQPFVSLFPVVSEAPSLATEYERSPSRSGNFYDEGGTFGGSAIPGFPIQDDARSIRTSASATIKRSDSVSKIIRRIRGEGLLFICCLNYPPTCC